MAENNVIGLPTPACADENTLLPKRDLHRSIGVPVSTMSPVSSLSHNLSGMSVLRAADPSSPCTHSSITTSGSVHRVTSVRRRLSLSLEPMDPARARTMLIKKDKDSDDSPVLTHSKKSASFSAFSTAGEDHPTPTKKKSSSPYKSPSKRDASCFEDDDDDDDSNNDNAKRAHLPLRLSFDSTHSTVLKDIKNKHLSRVSGDETDIKCNPLRRSSSALPFKRMPRPWGSMTDIGVGLVADMQCSGSESKTVLPTMAGTHPDLNCISPDTVVDVIKGVYKESFEEYFIVDCRFPYEYEGGHIKNALNLTEQQVLQKFMTGPIFDRKVCLIFHCEFSSKRAPSSYRALRDCDRKANFANYPKLHYPELYYIHGGYKQFYEAHKEHCVGSYVEMRDENHSAQYKQLNKIRRTTRSKSLDCFAAHFVISAANSFVS